jgi:hypothetical protein
MCLFEQLLVTYVSKHILGFLSYHTNTTTRTPAGCEQLHRVKNSQYSEIFGLHVSQTYRMWAAAHREHNTISLLLRRRK